MTAAITTAATMTHITTRRVFTGTMFITSVSMGTRPRVGYSPRHENRRSSPELITNFGLRQPKVMKAIRDKRPVSSHVDELSYVLPAPAVTHMAI